MKRLLQQVAFRGKYLLLGVSIAYGLLFFVQHQAAWLALQKSVAILIRILPIIAIVILLMALLNTFLLPKQIIGHLGRNSGLKGWMWALTGGLISHGPMYAWYPLLKDLRSHGMRDGLIVVFFYSRAIKVPLLPMMIDYFGWTFALVLSFYTLVGALLQGWLLELLGKGPRIKQESGGFSA